MDRAALESHLREGLSLAEIGRRLGFHEATVGYWVKRYRLEAVHREKHAARGGLARDQLAALVQAGGSIAQIAEAVGRSKATVRHWLKVYGLRTRRSECRRLSTEEEHPIEDVVMRTCARHGRTEFKRRRPSG